MRSTVKQKGLSRVLKILKNCAQFPHKKGIRAIFVKEEDKQRKQTNQYPLR